MKVLHSSLRFDKPAATIAAEVERWARYRFDLITFTEATRFRGVIQAPGYQTIQPHGHPELAALVRDGIRVAADVLPLSDMGIPRRGGEKPYALRLDLPDVTVFVVHLPSGVERPGGFRRNTQATVWRDCVRSLAAAVARDKRPGRDVWVVGDFNVNARRRWVRRFWARHLGGFALTAPIVGTHGNRAIDYALIRNSRAYGVRTFLTAASDHRAVLLEPKPKEAKPMETNDPYALVKHDGKTVDRITHEALKKAEKMLGYPLTITQGSYNKGVGASAGTHDGGGVVDLAAFEAHRKVRILRQIGFAAWVRTPDQGPWSTHVHAVLIGNEKLAPVAQRQVTAYLNGRNGLADNAPDDGPRDWTHRRFVWPPKPTGLQKARDQLAAVAKHRPRLAKRINDFLNSTPKR